MHLDSLIITEEGNNRQHQGKLSPSIVPYIVAGTVGLSILILFVFCFYQQIKDYCCCCFACCSNRESEYQFKSPKDRPNQDDSLGSVSKSNSKSLDQIETRVPVLPASTGPPPTTPPPPTHHHAVAKTQKYIGNLLATGRRPPPPLRSPVPIPTTAPPAAKQVARTANIIGKILTTDGGNKRKRRK